MVYQRKVSRFLPKQILGRWCSLSACWSLPPSMISKVINDSLKLGSETNFGRLYCGLWGTLSARHCRPVTTAERYWQYCWWWSRQKQLGLLLRHRCCKSMVLVHLGARLLKGQDGYSLLELQDTVIANRYDSCIAGYPLWRWLLKKKFMMKLRT